MLFKAYITSKLKFFAIMTPPHPQQVPKSTNMKRGGLKQPKFKAKKHISPLYDFLRRKIVGQGANPPKKTHLYT